MGHLTKSQVFFWILIAFIAGVGVRSFVALPIAAIWALFVFAAGLGAAAFRAPRERRALFCLAALIGVFACGMLREFQKAELPMRSFDAFIGKRVEIAGVVSSEPVFSGSRQQFVVSIPDIKNQKILITLRQSPAYQYGDMLHLSGAIGEPANSPSGFDYRAYLAKDGVYYVMQYPAIGRIATGKGNPLLQFLFRAKAAFSQIVQQLVPEPESAFIGGILLGERRSIPQEVLDTFARTGTTHIIALSGYNITIIAVSLFWFFGALSLPFAVSFWCAIAGITLFTLLTGASASVVRASLMGVLALIAQKSGRPYSMRNALFFAGAAMIFYNPLLLRYDTSFQLSFLATAGLLYVSPICDRACDAVKRRALVFLRNAHFFSEERDAPHFSKKSFLRTTLVATLSAQAFVLPLIVYDFGALSLVSPAANIAILPVIPLTMLLGFATGAAGFLFLPLARFFAWCAWGLAHGELLALGAFSRLPFASIPLGKWAVIPLFFFYAYAAVYFWKKKRVKSAQ